jgi:hypothetical protein
MLPGCSSTRCRWWQWRKKVAETNVQGTDVKASDGWRKWAVRTCGRVASRRLSHARLLPPPARARHGNNSNNVPWKSSWRHGRWFGDQYSEETRTAHCSLSLAMGRFSLLEKKCNENYYRCTPPNGVDPTESLLSWVSRRTVQMELEVGVVRTLHVGKVYKSVAVACT